MKKLIVTSFLAIASLGVVSATAENTIDTNEAALYSDSIAIADSAKVAKDAKIKANADKLEADIKETKATPVATYDPHQDIKEKFIEGGVGFMSIVLICLIIGLAIAIERILVLNLATTNVKSLLSKTKEAIKSGGVDAARELTAKIPGPVASIFNQGLLRASAGPEAVEKTIVSYGSVEMGKLEKGMSWVSLFIALAPMFGFMGTVIGMIDAFESIQQAEDIKIDQGAYGIKTALLTTVAGLIVAVILQVLYNYCVSKIDSIVNQMEEASISLVDMLIEEEITK